MSATGICYEAVTEPFDLDGALSAVRHEEALAYLANIDRQILESLSGALSYHKHLMAYGPRRTRVDHCSCPPDHPAHRNLLRTSENESTVVA